MEFMDEDVDGREIKAFVISPIGMTDCRLNLGQFGGKGNFVPSVVGMHQVRIDFVTNNFLSLANFLYTYIDLID